jgi:hypothetical protein
MANGFGSPRQCTLLPNEDIGNRAEDCTPLQCEVLHCVLVIIFRDGAPPSELEMMRRIFPRVRTRMQRERDELRRIAEATARCAGGGAVDMLVER